MPRKIEPDHGQAFVSRKRSRLCEETPPALLAPDRSDRPAARSIILPHPTYTTPTCVTALSAGLRGDTTRPPGTLMRKTETSSVGVRTYKGTRKRTTTHVVLAPAGRPALCSVYPAHAHESPTARPIGRMDARTTLRAGARRAADGWMDRARGRGRAGAHKGD